MTPSKATLRNLQRALKRAETGLARAEDERMRIRKDALRARSAVAVAFKAFEDATAARATASDLARSGEYELDRAKEAAYSKGATKEDRENHLVAIAEARRRWDVVDAARVAVETAWRALTVAEKTADGLEYRDRAYPGVSWYSGKIARIKHEISVVQWEIANPRK